VTAVALALFAILHSAGGTPGRAEALAPVVAAESQAAKVDPLLIVAIMEKESNFRARIVSPDGRDVGLMGVRLDGAGLGYSIEGLKDPATNVRLGVRYLLERRGACRRLVGALSDYNAGPSNRCRLTDYGRQVSTRYQRLRALAHQQRKDPTS